MELQKITRKHSRDYWVKLDPVYARSGPEAVRKVAKRFYPEYRVKSGPGSPWGPIGLHEFYIVQENEDYGSNVAYITADRPSILSALVGIMYMLTVFAFCILIFVESAGLR